MDGTESLSGRDAEPVCRQEAGDADTGASALRLEGEWTIANAEELHQFFQTHVTRSPKVVLDLHGVQACDTAALQLICSLSKTAALGGRPFRIDRPSPAVESAASALGLSIGELAVPGKGGMTIGI